MQGENKGTMGPTQQDELAQLFAQNMQLSQNTSSPPQFSQPAVIEHVMQTSEPIPQAPVHFVSNHYTPTNHIRPGCISETKESPPPAYHDAVLPEEMAQMLRQHLINPSSLLPSQILLFKNANYEQRLRLLELWRISPPVYSTGGRGQHTWATTIDALRRETDARAMRTVVDAEPYITNGYQTTLSSQAMEPVYAANMETWQSSNHTLSLPTSQQPMEDQYGLYDQIRNHAEWERMNEQTMRENFATVQAPVGMGDEMMM